MKRRNHGILHEDGGKCSRNFGNDHEVGTTIQFIVKAYDGPDMLEKRMAVRLSHLEGMKNEIYSYKGHYKRRA